jgi:hypothetical protein
MRSIVFEGDTTPAPQGLSSRPVADCTSAEVAAAFTRSFEGYVVPLRFTPEAYERRFRGEDLDPYASRVYERDGAALVEEAMAHLPQVTVS